MATIEAHMRFSRYVTLLRASLKYAKESIGSLLQATSCTSPFNMHKEFHCIVEVIRKVCALDLALIWYDPKRDQTLVKTRYFYRILVGILYAESIHRSDDCLLITILIWNGLHPLNGTAARWDNLHKVGLRATAGIAEASLAFRAKTPFAFSRQATIATGPADACSSELDGLDRRLLLDQLQKGERAGLQPFCCVELVLREKQLNRIVQVPREIGIGILIRLCLNMDHAQTVIKGIVARIPGIASFFGSHQGALQEGHREGPSDKA
jgi:hypothetical protein